MSRIKQNSIPMSVQRRHYRLGREKIIHGENVSLSQVSPEDIPTVHERIHLQCNVWHHEWLDQIKSVIYNETGCPNCYSNRKMTLQDFQERVKENGLDYSLNYNEKITVACPVCEHVLMNHCYSHLKGKAQCPECHREMSDLFSDSCILK